MKFILLLLLLVTMLCSSADATPAELPSHKLETMSIVKVKRDSMPEFKVGLEYGRR